MGEEQRPVERARRAAWHEWRADRRIVGALCACVAVAAGVAWWRAGRRRAAPPAGGRDRRRRPRSAPRPSTTASPRALVVDVVGAVRGAGRRARRARARASSTRSRRPAARLPTPTSRG